MEEDTIDDAEDNSRSANAEGESKDSDEGEAAVFAKVAEGEAEVAKQVVEDGFPAGVADLFFDALEAAEFESCTAASFFWGDSCGYVIGDLAFEMEEELLIEFLLRVRFLEKAANAAHHFESSSARKIRPTASQRRSQLSTSAAICLRPFLVSE